ncbi:MAG: ATP synthase F0 subunit B [Clostridia bacterium]|nr:ATP synthase F0 subunit B [Clostridia bacterium]
MNINLGETAVDLIINILNILILFVIVKLLVYKPVKKFLDDRKARINEETSKAQKILDEATDTLKSKDLLLEESRKNAEAESEKIISEAKANADFIVAEAKKNAKTAEEKANAEIKAKKENFVASSKDEIAELAVNIAERILSRETNSKDNEKIIEDFFDEVNI